MGAVMLIGAFALDLVPKKAAGTAAGFTVFFWVCRWCFMCRITHRLFFAEKYGWDSCFILLLIASVISIIFMAFTLRYNMEKEKRKRTGKGNFLNKKSIIYIALASVALIVIGFFPFQ